MNKWTNSTHGWTLVRYTASERGLHVF